MWLTEHFNVVIDLRQGGVKHNISLLHRILGETPCRTIEMDVQQR